MSRVYSKKRRKIEDCFCGQRRCHKQGSIRLCQELVRFRVLARESRCFEVADFQRLPCHPYYQSVCDQPKNGNRGRTPKHPCKDGGRDCWSRRQDKSYLLDHGLDLSRTCLIGDSLRDIQCARRAGCGKVVLVRTGHGGKTEELCKNSDVKADHVADDLAAAVKWLLDK
ncbi:MAG: HAD hydrolase-like protein [Deltaproteobacteria bacterium]|nr:HAD hydrolase-like protein [Deltaproteobacteria bacterium]